MGAIVALLSSIPLLAFLNLGELPAAFSSQVQVAETFESVEVGYTETSPDGEQSGLAVPASASSEPSSVPRCNINAQPETVTEGDSVLVGWAAGGAEFVYISDGIGRQGPGGDTTVTVNDPGTEYFSMEAHNSVGVSTCADSITVERRIYPPTTNISDNNDPSQSGEGYTVSWNTDDGGASTNCSVDRRLDGGSWNNGVANSLNGSRNLSETTWTDSLTTDRWRISCGNSEGSDSDSTFHTIEPWGTQVQLTQSSTQGEHGTPYDISWRSKHANTCNIQVRLQHGNGRSWSNWTTVYTESFAARESTQGEGWEDYAHPSADDEGWRTETIDGSRTLSSLSGNLCSGNDLSCSSTLIEPLHASNDEPTGYNLRAQWRASCTNAAGTNRANATHLIYPYEIDPDSVTIDQNSNSTAYDGTPLPNDESGTGDPFDIIWTSENAAECSIERREEAAYGGFGGGTGTYTSGWTEIWHTDDAGVEYDDTESTVGTADGADNEQDWRITCTNERPSGTNSASDSLEHYVWALSEITFEICDYDGSNCEDVEKLIQVDEVDGQAPQAEWSTDSRLSTDECQPVGGSGFSTGGDVNGTDPLPRPEPDTASDDNSELYTIGCGGNGGTATEDVNLRTQPLPHLETDDYSVRIGEEIEVRWDTAGGDPYDCTLTGSNGRINYSSTTQPLSDLSGTSPAGNNAGHFDYTINNTTTFDLECENGSHSITIFAIPVIHET